MNTLRHRIATIIAVAFLFTNLSAQEVSLSGKVFDKDVTISEVKFEVYANNELIETTFTKKSGKFKLQLEESQDYVILVSKEGYLVKTINLSMVKENKEDHVPSFQFDIDLYKKQSFRYVNKNLQTKPAANIFYNEALGMLDWDRSVTAEAKEQIAELKKLNADKRRSKFKSF
jgi:hypothetical protein